MYYFLAFCTTGNYTKDNGDKACGVLLNRTMGWQTAATECRSIGARLPVIKSLKENKDILNMLVSKISHSRLLEQFKSSVIFHALFSTVHNSALRELSVCNHPFLSNTAICLEEWMPIYCRSLQPLWTADDTISTVLC